MLLLINSSKTNSMTLLVQVILRIATADLISFQLEEYFMQISFRNYVGNEQKKGHLVQQWSFS